MDTGTYSLQHVPLSPFTINLQTQENRYCLVLDMIDTGFGYTRRSTIVEQPAQVVSGEQFTVKIAPKNIFYKQFVQS